MNYITICFDDGILESAKKACEMIEPNHLSFFIVTGWLEEYFEGIDDEENVCFYHGGIQDWKEIYKLGHDVGAHGHTHTELNDENHHRELHISYKILTNIHNGPYYVAYPYKQKKVEEIYPSAFDWVRTQEIFIPNKNRYSFAQILRSLLLSYGDGQNLWSCMVLHGLDGEGWLSWNSEMFEALLKWLGQHHIVVKSISEMLELTKNKEGVII